MGEQPNPWDLLQHASLDRLGTDYIDLLHFHFDDPTVPLEESLGAVDLLVIFVVALLCWPSRRRHP